MNVTIGYRVNGKPIEIESYNLLQKILKKLEDPVAKDNGLHESYARMFKPLKKPDQDLNAAHTIAHIDRDIENMIVRVRCECGHIVGLPKAANSQSEPPSKQIVDKN